MLWSGNHASCDDFLGGDRDELLRRVGRVYETVERGGERLTQQLVVVLGDELKVLYELLGDLVPNLRREEGVAFDSSQSDLGHQ